MPTTLYDVIVVGAGPAGSTAARYCSEKGLNTLLIDKAVFPRYKPCGGSLSLRAIRCLDFELPPEMIDVECMGVKVYYGEKSASYKKSDRIAAMVSREKFDNLLYEKAKDSGCTTLMGEKAASVETEGKYIKVKTERGSYYGRFVIGADGANSIVSRFLNGSRKDYLSATALVSEIHNHEDRYEKGVMHFYFGYVYDGYAWIFPHGRYLSVGVWGIKWLDSNPLDSMKRFLNSHNFSPGSIRGHTMPLWDRKRRIYTDKILLVGDAAGFIDSFSGEGISAAILSGKIAAESMTTALADGKSPGDDYKRGCCNLFANNLKYALHFSQLIYKFPQVFLDKFVSDSSFLKRYIDDQTTSNTLYRYYMRGLVRIMNIKMNF